jgi:Flp pilus assembly protein TadG
MGQKTFQRVKKVLLNQTGQMSIFVALIFQVLFVLFAMVINIGLLVHDKINLQNAVDLGAYYAAERQSEVLNEIGHINYQIRQDYKLLTWRYRVLGTLGRYCDGTLNPAYMPPALKTLALGDKAWVSTCPTTTQPDYPSVCVANPIWAEFLPDSTQRESYCYGQYNQPVPLIPSVTVIAPFVPEVGASAAFTAQAQVNQLQACAKSGPLSWDFLMQIIYAYKLSIASRKQIILALRANLIDPNPKDQQDLLVKDGVRATIMRNLTQANANSFSESDFQVLNGLSLSGCNQGDGGDFVLPEIPIAPKLLYTYNVQDTCTPNIAPQTVTSGLDPTFLAAFDPSGTMRSLAQGEPALTDPLHSSLGYEKNPWCMAYMGVKAKTKPHKPFAPFGTEIQLEARSFAQPFGGRVGPWYTSQWPSGSPTSSGGDRLDPLTNARQTGSGGGGSTNVGSLLPNYSRYPGDTLGLTSEITMGAERQILMGYNAQPKAQRLHLAWYGFADQITKTGDVLATDGTQTPFAGPAGSLRKAEVAAVAPDLYDITYYSIDPAYDQNYLNIQAGNGQPRFQSTTTILGNTVQPLPDLGGVLQGSGWNTESQITMSITGGGLDPSLLGQLYYAIRQWQHLLTGWAPLSAQNFAFPTNRFQQCAAPATAGTMIPGKCAQGGRVGYSVRFLSRNYLMSSNWQVGGDGGSAGPILNPPDPSF